jgi:hypothetical protein
MLQTLFRIKFIQVNINASTGKKYFHEWYISDSYEVSYEMLVKPL